MDEFRSPVTASETFPFDIEFQKSLIRLLAEDDAFAFKAAEHLKSTHFESEALQWAFREMSSHMQKYGAAPSLNALQNMARTLDASTRPLYEGVVEQIKHASLRDEVWLRDRVLDFVKRNIFVQAFREGKDLYNAGKVNIAYDQMMERMDAIARTTWESVDQSNFFNELQHRQAVRKQRLVSGEPIPTGFPTLDRILGGGLSLGELGVWLGYPKAGKSTMLLTHGVAAARRHFPTLHIVLEGSRKLIEDRYEAAFMEETYQDVKHGNILAESYGYFLAEYQALQDMLIIRSFVDKWDCNILDIDGVLRDLERSRGWRPKLIIIDYADLLTGRDKKLYRSETDSQRAAYRDVKRLTNRDYAVWTASQARRIKDGDEDKEHLLTSASVADTYEKVRAADFLGSLNQTRAEKQQTNPFPVLRLYPELYRDNACGDFFYVQADMRRMLIRESAKAMAPIAPDKSTKQKIDVMQYRAEAPL